MGPRHAPGARINNLRHTTKQIVPPAFANGTLGTFGADRG